MPKRTKLAVGEFVLLCALLIVSLVLEICGVGFEFETSVAFLAIGIWRSQLSRRKVEGLFALPWLLAGMALAAIMLTIWAAFTWSDPGLVIFGVALVSIKNSIPVLALCLIHRLIMKRR